MVTRVGAFTLTREMLEASLSRDLTAPGRARRLLTEQFGARASAEELESAQLLVSELVTNSVAWSRQDHDHGRGRSGPIARRRRRRRGRIRYRMHERGFDELGGRGLWIVDAAASRWGVYEGTTHVWFEIERTVVLRSARAVPWLRDVVHTEP